MATRGETNYSCCSACLDDGRNTVARHYCVNCEMYFCTKCVKCHNKIPATRKHQVNVIHSSDSTDADDDTTSLQSDVPSEAVQSLRCTLHQGKPIDTHCKDHDEVCCGACVVVKHRLCTTVSIAVAAKDFNSSPEISTCNEMLTDAIVMYHEEKEKRIENIECIRKQKLELIENVDKYEEKIIEKIKVLANISRNEIRSKYEEHKASLDTDIETLDVMIATNTEYTKQLEQIDNERLFIYMKTNKAVTKDGELLLQAMMTVLSKIELKFNFDEALDNQILQMKAFGVLEEHTFPKEYKATFHKNVDIKQSGDHHDNSYVYDACLMDSGDLLVTDDEHKKLKRFNSDLKFKDDIMLSGQPVAVCKINTHEVAVRIKNIGVVQCVSVGDSMQLTSSFTLADDGYGMAYDALTGEILACGTDRVSVYSKTGDILRTYDKDTNGKQMFFKCRQIALDKQDICITDYQNGLIILDKNGTLKINVSVSGVRGTRQLCILPGNICLVGSEPSGVIVQVDKDGKQVGNLIDTKDGRSFTLCAIYDRKHSRLIVGGSEGVISVYTLSVK